MLAGGVCALAADWLTRPSGNAAQAAEAAQGAESLAGPAAMPPPPPIEPAAILSRRIATAATGAARDAAPRDIFCVPAPWSDGNCHAAIAGRDDARLSFEQSHRLEGVVMAGSNSSTLVNGMLVKLGEYVDSHRLVAIGHDTALFEGRGGRVTLRIEDPSRPPAARSH